MQPGEVYRIRYPQLDGREQAGERPSLILQDDRYAARSPLVVAVPLSSTPGVVRFPAVVPVPVTAQNGLTVDSFALVFQVRAVDRVRVLRRLGFVTPAILAQVYEALDRLTGRIRSTPPAGSPP